jgi:hypothetical protein
MSDRLRRLISDAVDSKVGGRLETEAPSLTDAFRRFQDVVRKATEATAAMAATKPRESWYIPRDQIYFFTDPATPEARATPWVHPSTMMKLENNGRVPFFSAHTSGNRELERDRRRRAR